MNKTQTTIMAIEATNRSLGARSADKFFFFFLLNKIDVEEDRRTQ